MTEDIEGTVADEGPEPDLAAVTDFLPQRSELAVSDLDDAHEKALVMDAHDVQMILERAQTSALKKWVYQLPDGTAGLTVDAVQDLTQQFNWTGKARIGLLPDTLKVERITEDMGDGPEPLWVATVFARDEVTGQMQSGSSMEPVYMKLTEKTAAKWRQKGKKVPEDRRVFDVYSRTKAINKAERNAQAKFIPEEIEQTVIAMFVKDPRRVERIRTEAEVKVAELPPPLDDDEARALIGRAEEVYAEIRELGGGRGKIKMTPGTFNAWKLQAQHSHDRLRDFITYLEERREQIPVELQRDDEEREAVESANDVACPACDQPAGRFCKGVRGAHGERVRARLEQIRGAGS
jgi:hypothetical protein